MKGIKDKNRDECVEYPKVGGRITGRGKSRPGVDWERLRKLEWQRVRGDLKNGK